MKSRASWSVTVTVTAFVLLTVFATSNALYVASDVVRTRAAANDLCLQKQQAANYCFQSGSFNSTLCSQQVVTAWLTQYDIDAQKQSFRQQDAEWNYLTNLTAATQAETNIVSAEVKQWFLSKLVEALRYPFDKYDSETKAQLKRITTTDALCDSEDIARLIELNGILSEKYSSMTACFNYTGTEQCLTGQSAFANEMSEQEDYNVLLELWLKYHEQAKSFRTLFTERVGLLNKGARENGFADSGYYEWFTDVGDADFLSKMMALLNQIDPLYRELHAYVRYKLHQVYKDKVDLRKAIPIHLTRNMYGQTWGDLIGLVKPYANVPDTDITPELVRQNYTAEKIFRMAEAFFSSIDCYNMTDVFWNKSMIERPSDGRLVECHGSAWDLQVPDDYRIKMCTVPTMTEFVTVHHEMGHVEYFMAYRSQPYIYRDGGQSGFHEAVGDTIALSVLTPEHLYKVGLLKTIPDGEEYNINFLMTTALDKLPFFSFALMMDLWRWGTFDGSIAESQFNQAWWRKRLELGGIMPPEDIARDETFFDPGAKYHVTNNVPYIRYFMSFFLQFQFYERMCNLSNHTGPLHRCDFYQSKEAGRALKSMLSMGRSVNWHDQLEAMTGSREIDASSILNYFDPLYKWLKKYNSDNNIVTGWEVPSSAVQNRIPLELMIVALLVSFLRAWR